ncbi:hypothetical protein [Amycolatopsis sp. FDAARGOS 1241]|uniref:hypothetical protein n=1 Tax=Amycolatopsis sp. FDAARGOS 1241 TaxID=2778070 RepID=UPI00195000F9|nr:hypothetical protein [Amycolatopsis sp. FDAARGOS 1241]QRP45353.1 hypothetical protein I6J71_40415 [Amycolatopsis sp. FDAARGOS 1241]
MTKRTARAALVLGAVLLATACGHARAGTALPDGDQVSAYVGAKFEKAMPKLEDSILAARDVTNSFDAYFRFDEKSLKNTITSARAGSPESRVVHNRSQRNPDEIIDTFTPADGTLEYLYLGPEYKSLEPTSWVSMPKPDAGLVQPCVWGGVLSVCKMAQAVDGSYQADKKAVLGAKSTPDGSVELTVNVPFSQFLDKRVELLPPDLVAEVGPQLKKAVIPTTIKIKPDGSLDYFTMAAEFSGDGHNLELRYDFRFTGKATAADMPKLPDPSQVTNLPDDNAKQDFYRRLAQLQGS